jgi:adenylosuccinate synthase
MSKALLAIGLAFGDEGKGSVVDALTRREGASLVVRFNGGAQAAHNVVTPDGQHHVFAQFGSGTLAGARTHLSRFMLVNPMTLLNEAAHLEFLGIKDSLSLMTIEREALVTTPLHMAMNKLRELARGDARHGSCGMGIGETVAYALAHPYDALRVGDLEDEPTIRRKLGDLCDRLWASVSDIVSFSKRPAGFFEACDDVAQFKGWPADNAERMAAMVAPMRELVKRTKLVDRDWLPQTMEDTTTIFEGAQGVLLDQTHGFQPHTTWSDCTFGNANALIEGFTGDVTRLGITRAFMTRHGAGPLPTESVELAPLATHDHNKTGQWQGSFRVGALDLPLLRYARSHIDMLDGLIVTNIDRLNAIDPSGVLAMRHFCNMYSVDGDLWHAMRGADGNTLKEVTPLYSIGLTPQVPMASAAFIADQLSVPLYGISTGPTHADKTWIK